MSGPKTVSTTGPSTGPYLDDRGAPMPWHSPREITSRLGIRRSTLARLGERALSWAIFGCVLAFWIYEVSTRGWPSWTTVLPYIIPLAVFYIAVWAWHFARPFWPVVKHVHARPLPRANATVLAWGHCGACGERLTDLASDHDGCATCPNCAAAWNADRWSRGTVREHDVHRALYEVDEYAYDARGVTLTPGVFSRERWITPNPLEDTSPPAVPSRRDRRIAARRAMDRVRERWLLATAAFVVAIILASFGVAELIRQHVNINPVPLVLLPNMLIGLVAVPFARRRASDAYARAALKQGLCPNCGMIMSESARVEFDGCVSCAQCGRAWKAADVKQPPPLPTSATAREPWLDAAIRGEGAGRA